MDVYLSIILQAQEILLSAEGTSENTREKLSTELASLAKEVGARREILDSGCSISMSGIDGRLTETQERRSTARAANGGQMRYEVIGTNEDQVQEIKVNGMANDLVLLAMRQYA
jgi:hypothetical protein